MLDKLKAEAAFANLEAEAAQNTAQLSKEAAHAVNAYWDQMLEDKLGALEKAARRREWTIGTVIALVAGVLSIVFAHFLFHF